MQVGVILGHTSRLCNIVYLVMCLHFMAFIVPNAMHNHAGNTLEMMPRTQAAVVERTFTALFCTVLCSFEVLY